MNANQETAIGIVKTLTDACAASGRILIAGIEQAKWKLVAEFRNEFGLPERLFRSAVNQAEALAWETEYPQLVFPALAVEKLEAVRRGLAVGNL
jgi:hypothetical protein